MPQADILGELIDLLGPERVLGGPAQLAAYQSDGLTSFQARPRVVVLPDTQTEVVDTVRLCHRHGVPFMARGSGTSLSGGAVPVEDGVLIALSRLNRIVRYEPGQRLAVVEPGVVNHAISARAAADGLYYAPDPSSGPVCTIGGNVAFNSGGAHCLKYGMTSNHVLGIKAVLPDGQVVELGGESLEPGGPDLVGMFVGSEGLLGVALEIGVRLLPRPETRHTVLAAYDSLEKAGHAVSLVVASGLLPGAMEIMDRLAMDAAEIAVGVRYAEGARAVLIVELEGPREEVAAEQPRLDEVLRRSEAFDVHVAADETERATIWKGRKSAFSAVGRLSPDFIVQDGVVPRSRLGEALAEIERLSAEYGCRVANVFHAGDGNLHPLIMYDSRAPGAWENAERLAGEILRMCIRMGGSITGEHGVGLEKRDYLAEMFAPADVGLMRRIRQCVDPLELANRGKMFPGGEAPALAARGLHPLEKQGIVFRE